MVPRIEAFGSDSGNQVSANPIHSEGLKPFTTDGTKRQRTVNALELRTITIFTEGFIF